MFCLSNEQLYLRLGKLRNNTQMISEASPRVRYNNDMVTGSPRFTGK